MLPLVVPQWWLKEGGQEEDCYIILPYDYWPHSMNDGEIFLVLEPRASAGDLGHWIGLI